MNRVFLFVSVLLVLLSACAPAARPNVAPVATDTSVPGFPSATEPAGVPTEAPSSPKLPGASFEAQTYINETAGFALDYPAGWTVNEMVVGPRGTQVQFLSSPELAEAAALPEGATRVSANLYQWDPKNDLAAFIEHQKGAWEASGFTVIDEQELMLDLGVPAREFTVQTPEAQAVFLIAALGEQYLVVSGEGNLDLVKEMVQRVRPISR
jgi:hypothetical protein